MLYCYITHTYIYTHIYTDTCIQAMSLVDMNVRTLHFLLHICFEPPLGSHPLAKWSRGIKTRPVCKLCHHKKEQKRVRIDSGSGWRLNQEVIQKRRLTSSSCSRKLGSPCVLPPAPQPALPDNRNPCVRCKPYPYPCRIGVG